MRGETARAFMARARFARCGAYVMEWRHTLLETIFQPDVITHDQFFGERRETSANPAVRRLMYAVLEDAVRTFQSNAHLRGGPRYRLYREAEMWLLDARADGIFSCESVCAALGIDAAFLRRGIREWRRRERAGEKQGRLTRRTPVLPDNRIKPPAKRRRARA